MRIFKVTYNHGIEDYFSLFKFLRMILIWETSDRDRLFSRLARKCQNLEREKKILDEMFFLLL